MAILTENGHADPNPRDHFFIDFNKFISKRISNNEELIICMDANKVDEAGSQLCKFRDSHDL
eukprot:10441565-Ditylum_brightwellii.AAC.1